MTGYYVQRKSCGNGSVLANQPGGGLGQHTVRDRHADHGIMVSDIVA